MNPEDLVADGGGVGFLKLLQMLSPEVQKTNVEKYIPKSEAGMFCLGSEIIGAQEGDGYVLSFIPIAMKDLWTEWIPRKAGGGKVREYATEAEANRTCKAGNDLIHSVELLARIDDQVVRFSMSGSKKNAARNLRAMCLLDPSISAHSYKLKSYPTKNKAGQPFWNVTVEQGEYTAETTFNEILEVRDQVMASLEANPAPQLEANF